MRDAGAHTQISARLLVSLSLTSMAGWVSGLLHQQALFNEPLRPRCLLVMVTLGGMMGGFFRGVSFYAKTVYILPFVLYCATLTFSTASYFEARGRVLNAELLLPSTAAMVPFSIVYCAANRHLDSVERRRRREDLED